MFAHLAYLVGAVDQGLKWPKTWNVPLHFVATIIIVMYGWLCNVGHADTFSLRIITLHHHAGCKALESDCKFSFFIL